MNKKNWTTDFCDRKDLTYDEIMELTLGNPIEHYVKKIFLEDSLSLKDVHDKAETKKKLIFFNHFLREIGFLDNLSIALMLYDKTEEQRIEIIKELLENYIHIFRKIYGKMQLQHYKGNWELLKRLTEKELAEHFNKTGFSWVNKAKRFNKSMDPSITETTVNINTNKILENEE